MQREVAAETASGSGNQRDLSDKFSRRSDGRVWGDGCRRPSHGAAVWRGWLLQRCDPVDNAADRADRFGFPALAQHLRRRQVIFVPQHSEDLTELDAVDAEIIFEIGVGIENL